MRGDFNAARQWLADDPDADTRAELHTLIHAAEAGDAAAASELADAFAGTLEFGTAGLRGRMGPGPNRMNAVVVARAAAGLARYLTRSGGGMVVVGYDARRKSDQFARRTAEIIAGAGLTPLVLDRPLPTPILAFAVRHFGCAAGVMVTASHNPPEDNGYKVYLADGSQIVPPADADISSCIAEFATVPVSALPTASERVVVGDDLVDAYLTRTVTLLEQPTIPASVRVVYTPMHGVGGEVFLRLLKKAGMRSPAVVAEQFEPDGAFPTVSFPNPEEPGAMDLALAKAAQIEADLVIAHDPDADRCAVGVPSPDGWRMLSGDEVGALLGWWIAAGNRRIARRGVLASSIVSSNLLAEIAEDFHLGYEQTLTGFKWIAKVPDLMFGYEEALGYCVDPNGVRDKDGLSAALMVIEMAGRLQNKDRTLLDVLDDLALRYGVYSTAQLSVRVDDLHRIGEVMSFLRNSPPDVVAGQAVAQMDDLADGGAGLPATDGLRFMLTSGARIIVRPSGTEPKIKCYLQSVVQVHDEHLAQARAQAADELRAMAADVARWLQ